MFYLQIKLKKSSNKNNLKTLPNNLRFFQPFQNLIFIEKIAIYKSEIIENKLTYTPIKIINIGKDKL